MNRTPSGSGPRSCCACVTSRIERLRRRWVHVPVVGRVAFILVGLVALAWFLVRVVPKPSRAAYPCQRVAMPLASGFVLWLIGLLASAQALRLGARRLARRPGSLVILVLVGLMVVTATLVVVTMPQPAVMAMQPQSNSPVGIARGTQPGRVVWVHDPDATDWDGPESGRRQYDPEATDPVVTANMFDHGIRMLTGETNLTAAWDAMFRSLNEQLGRGTNGYQAGETVAIKINGVTCASPWPWEDPFPTTVDPVTWEKSANFDRCDPAPALTLALLNHLVHTAGVAQADIAIGDTLGLMPKHYYDRLHGPFPDLVYLDHLGGTDFQAGGIPDDRVPIARSNRVPFHWSTDAANGMVQDYVPDAFADADYLINCALLKTHNVAGVTLCAKNHYGSLYRRPPGYDGEFNFHHDHQAADQPALGSYRPVVDLMGHRELGGKTVLYMINGLYGGVGAPGYSYRWTTAPFNGDWPSSIFLSQDPVAIDSVGHDFLGEHDQTLPTNVRYLDPMEGGVGAAAADYLVEAALADAPPSRSSYDPEGDGTNMVSLGVHEHWNNATDKQYSRDLGFSEGIELVRIDSRGDPRMSPKLYVDSPSDEVSVYMTTVTPLHDYQLLRSPSLETPTWTTVAVFRASNTATNWTDSSADGSGFYRLERLP